MAMAIAAIVSRRRALLPLLLLPSPPLSSPPPPLSSPPPPPLPLLHLPFSSSSSLSPCFPFKSTIPTSPDPETSDFELDPDDPPSAPDDSDLPDFLQLLSHAKSLSASRKDALALLQASSGVERSRVLVRRALWELRWDWESAMLALRWGEECVLDCPAAWHLVIWAMGKQGRFDMAWSVVRRMYKRSILTQRAMVIMMERYAAANEAGKAIKTFHAMEKFKIDSDLTTFYALLCALCKNKNVEEAEELLLVNKKFFPLSAESFNIILGGWCNIMVDITEAKRVWREMASCCITPDGNSYTHMIRCFSKVGNLFDSLRLYDEMKKRGWAPDLAVYNSLVYVLTRENCLKDAQNIFSKILDEGLQPTVETFNSMIYPLCESQKIEEARMVMEDMMVKGISPDMETYHAFIKEESIDETLRILRRMRDARCGPTKYTFLLLFDKYFGLNESENALRMWSEMRRYVIDPDSSHYIALVEGLVKHGWMPKALEFYDEMKDRGFTPDPKLEKVFKEFIESNKDHWGRVGKDYIISQRGKRNTLRGAAVQ